MAKIICQKTLVLKMWQFVNEMYIFDGKCGKI